MTMLMLLPFTPVDIQSEEDLMSPGTTPGSVPTDLEHAVGLERLEIIAKMEGVDIFDMKPLDASRMGRCCWPKHAAIHIHSRHMPC